MLQSFNSNQMDERFWCCLTQEPSHLVSLHSSWDSNQTLQTSHHSCGRRSPLCCSWSLWLAEAGCNRDQMDLQRSRRSCCPSRLSRPHPWSWQSRMSSDWYNHKYQQKSGWTQASISSHSQLLLYASCQGCEDRVQGGLLSWRHLWLSRWAKNYFSPLTFTATAFCRAKCRLPESSSSGRVGDTRKCEVLRTMVAAAMFGIVAILGSSRWYTKVARFWRQRRTFIWRRLTWY